MTEVQVILTHSKVVSSDHRVILLPQDIQKQRANSKLVARRGSKLGEHAHNTYSEIVDKYKAICDARDITDIHVVLCFGLVSLYRWCWGLGCSFVVFW